jgi:4-amino-4-deoxy-L-arabinose transferase-like glycosyltransferase
MLSRWGRAEPWIATGTFLAILGGSAWRRLAMLPRLSFDYDEGVYWQSLESMRHGHRLFVEVFSSQPPFFLAGMYPLYNLLGGGIVAGRTPVMLGSLVSLAAIFVIGRSLAGTWTGLAAMALAAFDPLYLDLADRLQADLPSVVIGVVAVAVAAHSRRRGAGAGLWLAAGFLLGLSVMTKLLGVVFLVPMAWLALGAGEGRRWRSGAAALGAVAAVLLALLPFAGELGTVYAQVIGLHLGTRVSEPQSLAEKVKRVIDSYPVLIPALAALLTCAIALARRVGWVAMLVLWVLAALAVDLAQGPLFIHHLVVLVPPMALLAGAAPALAVEAIGAVRPPAAPARPSPGATPRSPAARIVAVSVAVIAGLGLRAIASPMPPADRTTAPTITALRTWVPRGAPVVTDELFAAAWTGHPVPPNLVDQSHARITTGELTPSRVEADTDAFHARAVIFATGRLETLAGFKAWVAQRFRLVDDAGDGLQVWIRTDN